MASKTLAADAAWRAGIHRATARARVELHKFLTLSAREIADEYRRIISRSKEDPGTAGDEAEELWRELLERWLPDYYHVVTKGRIINEAGEASPQIDVLVLSPAYPRAIRSKKIYLAGGVVAAFECKTTLRGRDLGKFFRTCRSVKRLYRNGAGTIRRELFAPIYFGLLALSSDVRGHMQRLVQKLDRAVVRHPREMPDVLCVADREIILPCKTNNIFDKDWFQQTANGRRRALPIRPVWTSYYSGVDPKGPFVLLGVLIQSLYYSLGWKDEHIRDMHNFFEETELRPEAHAAPRQWTYGIYSKPVRAEFRSQAKLTNGIRWSEWSVGYL